MKRSASREALLRGTPYGRVCSARTCVAPGGERLGHRDRRGQPAVDVAPAADLDRRAPRPGHAAGGQDRVAQLALGAHAAEVHRGGGPHVHGDAVQGDRAGHGAVVATGIEALGVIGQDVVHVDDRPPPQHPRRVDERARRERAVVGRDAAASDPGDERAAVDGAGRGADHQVEARGQAEALQRGRHAGRDDAAHAAALEREGHAVRDHGARPGSSRSGPLAQDLGHGMRQVSAVAASACMSEHDTTSQAADGPPPLRGQEESGPMRLRVTFSAVRPARPAMCRLRERRRW